MKRLKTRLGAAVRRQLDTDDGQNDELDGELLDDVILEEVVLEEEVLIDQQPTLTVQEEEADEEEVMGGNQEVDKEGEQVDSMSHLQCLWLDVAGSIVEATSNPAESAVEASGDAPTFLSEEVCLVPGVPVVRVEVAPGNARRIFTGIDIIAEIDDVCDVVWRVLTDYEHLADAVPNLVENRVVEWYEGGGARLEQVGAAKLAPMLVFKATTTLDVQPYIEGLPAAMEAEHLDDAADSNNVREFGAALPLQWDIYPRPYCISSLPRRDITMQGVKDVGDFRFYQGVWRMQALPACAPPGHSAMRLTYSVELSPKAWVPVALLEGQIASTLGENLESVRDYVSQPKVLEKYTRAR